MAIPPPPPGQEALPGGVPEDLSQDNLSTWAETVQDVAAGMIAPQPETSQTIFPQVVEVLTLLESVSRVTFCRQCYLPGSACRCLGGSSTASTASTAGQSWSDIADPTFGPNSASAGGGAGSAPPYGSPATAGGSISDPPSADYPRLPGAPTAICQPRPPAGRASHLESQLMAIRYGRTAPPDPLRPPRPTWGPPTTQPRRPVQPPPPPPRTDSASMSDQSQQTTARDWEQEGQGTQRPGRARARGRAHKDKDKPASAVPRQRRISQLAQGRSGGASQSEQQRAPDWNPLAKISTHRSGGWKKDLDCYIPLGHSSAGATRSVPSPHRCPSTSRSHDAPTIPASDDGRLYTGYRSGSPTGRGRTTPSRVPTMKKGRRYCRCPRHRPEYGGCWRLLPPEWQRRI